MSGRLNKAIGWMRRLTIGILAAWPVIVSAQNSTALVVTTATPLPAGVVGQPYSQTFAAAGRTAPYHWNFGGTLPAGLQLSPSTGTLSGTPSVAATFNFIIQVVDVVNATSTKAYSVTVISPASQFTITTASLLSAGTVGVPYSQVFSATGGVAPYRWGASGTLPAGLQLDQPTGQLSGTPAAAGIFSFTIQVSDATNANVTKTVTVTVNPTPLSITTQSPLFNATSGIFYSQNFQAGGGMPPYTWALISGPPPSGLNFDTNQGALSGTPSSSGVFSLAIEVTDGAGSKVSKTFSLNVLLPKLTITTGSPLPNGVVGANYLQAMEAAGGRAPYTWSLSGVAPSLEIEASAGVLSGTPSTPGTYTFTVQAKDADGAVASKVFVLAIIPGALSLTTSTELPGGTLGQTYSHQMTAAGGTPPYSWSANGLPDGLTLDSSTGLISGKPQIAGPLLLTVTVTDSARATATNLFRLNVGVPAAPSVTVSGLPSTSGPAEQSTVRVSLGSLYPIAISGQLTISFSPDVGPGDSTIQFVTGGRTANFTIPAGAADAQFSISSLGLQTGTVAGSITVTAQLSAGGIDITPSPAPSVATQVNRAAPVITSAKVVRSGNGFSLQITGFSTAREVTSATFRFKASGASIPEITVQTGDLFSKWYQGDSSSRFGSQFLFIQPFTVQGDANIVTLDTVSLANSLGTVSSQVN